MKTQELIKKLILDGEFEEDDKGIYDAFKSINFDGVNIIIGIKNNEDISIVEVFFNATSRAEILSMPRARYHIKGTEHICEFSTILMECIDSIWSERFDENISRKIVAERLFPPNWKNEIQNNK